VGDLDMMSKNVPNQAGRGAPKKIYGLRRKTGEYSDK
jgi:hypothetical protein